MVRGFRGSLHGGLGVGLSLLLLAEPAVPALAQQTTPASQSGTSQTQAPLPSSPMPTPEPTNAQPESGTSASQPQSSGQTAAQQQGGQNPVGTAAAPYEKGIGTAASRPAGAVVAPAKQRRTHTLLIRVGLVVGAAVAIGTVIGLSKASPSTPSH